MSDISAKPKPFDADDPVSDYDIRVPDWIDSDITWRQVSDISQYGCSSGAYMPGVNYYDAANTMREHGNDVVEYISDCIGVLPHIEDDSWLGYQCKILSTAVKLWTSIIDNQRRSAERDRESEILDWERDYGESNDD